MPVRLPIDCQGFVHRLPVRLVRRRQFAVPVPEEAQSVQVSDSLGTQLSFTSGMSLRIRNIQGKLVGFAPHPFYRTAQAQAFLATRSGKVCGRIAAVLNRAYNQYHENPLGFFGFFESIDDQSVAAALFSAVRDWFSTRGIHAICGPVSPGLEYTVGLLVEGFDSSPMFLTSYNPPYYAGLLEACGLDKSQDLLAYGGKMSMLPEFNARLGPIAEQIADRYGIRVRQLSWRQMLDRVDTLTDIYNRSMGEHW